MKKKTLLAITALTVLCMGGQSLTASAAPGNNFHVISGGNGNHILIGYGSDCNQSIQDILNNLKDCLPNISLPEIDQPETEAPESGTPETETPENGKPEIESPENNTPETESPSDEHAYIKEVVDLVNAERAKEGLAPLTINTKVQAAAQVRAKECEQRFSHTRPNGTSFATALKEQNVSYRSAGENIAWGQKTPKEVVTAWMNSSGHRANIMNAGFTTIGVGYYENARGTDYWCQLFTS